MTTISSGSVDEYIARFPESVQEILQQIRVTIQQAAPEARETIKYQMPTFTLEGNLLSFGAFKNHIGLYPAPEGDEQFNRALSAYKSEKSTVKFRLDEPIPYDLISRIVMYRIQENQRRLEARNQAKASPN